LTWTIESVTEADVDPAAVFALYADPSSWSSWGHNAAWARAAGPLVEGGTVDVRAGYGTVYHCLIRRLDPGRALELVVRPAFMTIINFYEVEPTAGGARVRHAFEVSGPISNRPRAKSPVKGAGNNRLTSVFSSLLSLVLRILGEIDPGFSA